MALRKRHTNRLPRTRRVLRIESLEVRRLLAADVELLWAPLPPASGRECVGAISIVRAVAANPRSRAPSTSNTQTIAAPPTIDVKMPASALPDGAFRLADRRSPPINVAVEQVVRMPDSSRIPEGTIQLVGRPRPTAVTVAFASGPAFLESPNDLCGLRSESLAQIDLLATSVAKVVSEPGLGAPCPPAVELPTHKPAPVVLAASEKLAVDLSESPCPAKTDTAHATLAAAAGIQIREAGFAELFGTPVATKTRGRNKG